MKTVKFKNTRGLNLTGDWYEAGNTKIIIMCHEFASDRIAVAIDPIVDAGLAKLVRQNARITDVRFSPGTGSNTK